MNGDEQWRQNNAEKQEYSNNLYTTAIISQIRYFLWWEIHQIWRKGSAKMTTATFDFCQQTGRFIFNK